MSKFVNIAGQSTSTVGNGELTLDNALTGYITFEQAGINNGDVIGYVIWDHFGPYGAESREVGRGTYNNNILTRDTIVTTTNQDGSYLECTGMAQVYVTAIAEDIRTAHVSGTPPTNPFNGQLWWDNTTGILYIYYKDINNSQWVSCINTTGANTYPSQIGDLNDTLNNIQFELHNTTINQSPGTNINIENGEIIILVLEDDSTLANQLSNGQKCKMHITGNDTFSLFWPTIKWINEQSPPQMPEYFVELWQINNILYGHYLGYIAQ